ncbi:MAG: histidinol-phosphate transaminase [Maledivibacter sp.]|jgi:histidinol-phosphate aminotransferase|nr:histidinol-phosphate transaminase [Maledivibacter sp.]
MKRLMKKCIENIRAYEVIEEEYDIKVDANESPYNILNELAPIILKDIVSKELNRYPDSEAVQLKKKIADYTGINTENIMCGNGSDELLKVIIDCFVDKGDVVVTHSPSFVMYRLITEIAGGKFIELSGDESFSIDIDRIISTANENDAKLIFLCNPNNPTGTLIPRDEIIRVLENTSSIVVVDEAYYEFYGETIIDRIYDYKRLIVLRTLSKAFGLAALRIGYGVSAKETMDILNRVKPPYNLNSISQYIGEIVLDNIDIVHKNIETIKKDRDKLFVELESMKDIKAIPSGSNFILIKTSRYEDLMKKFKEDKIKIKGFGTKGVLQNCIRITIGTKEENDRILKLLKEV